MFALMEEDSRPNPCAAGKRGVATSDSTAAGEPLVVGGVRPVELAEADESPIPKRAKQELLDKQTKRFQAMTPEFSIDIWKVMTSGNCFRELVENAHPVVLVVGPMGSGKSTNIGIQMGAKYEAIEEWSEEEQMSLRVYKKLQSDERTPQTSDGFTSKTLNIGLYVKKSGGFAFLDTAGIDEDRGEEYRLWTRWSLGTAFQILPKIKCVMLVLDYRSLFASRGKGVRELAKALSTVIGAGQSTKHFYDSMIFLITFAYEGPQQVTVQRIVTLAAKQCTEQENNFKTRHQELTRLGLQPDDDELQNTVAIITLLKTLSMAKDRIHMCYPDTAQKSQLQQQTVQRMIETSRPITKEALTAIAASRQTSNLQVIKMLVKIITEPYDKLGAKSYKDVLRQRANNLEQLLGLLNEQKDRLQAINSNWQVVQRNEVDKLERQRSSLETQMKNDQTKIRDLQISTRQVKVDDAEVKKEYPASGWWALCVFGGGWAWGKQSAEYKLQYQGKLFTNYKIRKSNVSGGDYERSNVKENGQTGYLATDFKSEPGTNLDLMINFFAQEKDTQEAKDMINNLARQVKAANQEIQELDQRITYFRSAESAHALANLYMSAKDQLQATEKEIIEELDQRAVPASEDLKSPPTEWAVLTHVFNLICVLSEKKMLPDDLPDSTSESINGFSHEYIRLKQLLNKLENAPGSNFVALNRQATPEVLREDDAPVAQSARAKACETLRSLWECFPRAIDLFLLLLDYIQHNSVAFAVALLAYGLLLRMWPIRGLQDAFGLHLIAWALFILTAKFLGVGVQSATMVMDAVDRKAQGIAGQAQGWADGVRQDVGGRIDRLTEDVKEEVEKATDIGRKTVKEQFWFKCSIQ